MKANPLEALRRFARPAVPADVEQCDFCSVPLPAVHRHLLEVGTRKVICACEACALRFDNVVGRFKLIPRDTRRLANFHLTDPQWESFSLPIALAFFYCDRAADKVIALYPSPAGATESLLPIPTWEKVVCENPTLAEMQPDVEALMVNRLNDCREYYLAPIDVCFELVGLIRVHWRGFSGGGKVWHEIEQFFARLKDASLTVNASRGQKFTEGAHA